MHRTLLALAATTIGLTIAGVPATSHAADWASVVEHCQGSLPSFEGALRKRPLAIANEGSSASFISCSMRMTVGQLASDVRLVATNRGSSAASVSCTLVSGVSLPFPFYPPTYVPKTVTIEPGAYGTFLWTSSGDNGGVGFRLPNLNCQLPPGVELNAIQVDYPSPA